MKNNYTINSHYLTYTCFSKTDERMYFLSLGVKVLNAKRVGPAVSQAIVGRGEFKFGGALLVAKRFLRRRLLACGATHPPASPKGKP